LCRLGIFVVEIEYDTFVGALKDTFRLWAGFFCSTLTAAAAAAATAATAPRAGAISAVARSGSVCRSRLGNRHRRRRRSVACYGGGADSYGFCLFGFRRLSLRRGTFL